MRKKKILYVITKSVWGGAQKYVYDLATSIPRDRFETVVVAGGKGILAEKLDQAGIRTITLPVLQERGGFFEVIFSFINIRALFALIRIFRRERPDVIHLNSSKVGGIGGVAAFIFKLLNFFTFKPVVVFTVHGWPFKEARPWWQKGAIFLASWLSSFFHDKVILISAADTRTAQRFILKRKLALIHNGIAPINFVPRKEARAFFAKKLGRPIADDTILIGTNAELTPNKGLEYLFLALPKLSKSSFNNNYRSPTSIISVIIGDGNERLPLERRIASLGLHNIIFLTGFIPDAARCLRGLDIFVLPSLKEGLPYTIMEAMAAGLAIVATNVGGIPDLISNGQEGLLVPPRNPEALGAALKKLIENEPQRNILGVRAREKVEKYFLLETMLAKTIKIYSS